MRKLDRKLLRDVLHMRSQLAAIALVVVAAVATYVTMNGSYEALLTARTIYYREARFADVFAVAKRVPLQVVDRIREIPGVARASARVSTRGVLDVPGLDEPATAALVGMLPGAGELNEVNVRRGRLPDPSRPGEALCGEQFALANGLEPGHTVRAVINGRWETLRITGLGGSPDYLDEAAGVNIFPDHKRFGVFWIPNARLAAALSMTGAFNDLAVTLAPGANDNDVIAGIDRLLAPYGGTGAYGRDEHPSYQFLRDELAQDRVTARVLPGIFLAVTAFLIHMVLARLVVSERDQIAIMKAFGYENGPIAAHYVKFALVVIAIGSIVGIPVGLYLGSGLTTLYGDFFNFPVLEFAPSAATVTVPVLVSVLVAVAAAVTTVRHAVSISPAEGMRGETPPAYHQTGLEWLHRFVSSAARMVLRSLERRPLRAALSIAGVAMAVMVLMVGRYTLDALNEIVRIHFQSAQRDDVTVVFTNPRSDSVRHELMRLPGVYRVETFRSVPARIDFGPRSRRIALQGLDRNGELRRLVDRHERITAIPESGVVLTAKLARILGARRGDVVRIQTLDQQRRLLQLPVVATADELIGIAAYTDRDTLAHLLGESGVSGAYLSIDPAASERLNRVLKTLPALSASSFREVMIRSFWENVTRSLRVSTWTIIIFACLIAFGVLYNNARIALSERGRDLAGLRVLGFTTAETGTLLLAEQAVLVLIGIPIGFAGGYGLMLWLVHLFDTEGYRLPAIITSDTYAFATLVTIAAAAISGAAVWQRIGRLDLVEVLKTRE
jgi:putative ABC transport system permease protein